MRRWRGQPGAATGGSLCRCSLRPVRRPAQLADWPPRRLGGHRRADETPAPSVCRLLSDRFAPTPVVLQKPARQASQTAETRDPRAPGRFPRLAKSRELCSPGALTPSAGRGKPPRQLTALGEPPGRLTRRLFTTFHSATLRSAPCPRAPPPRRRKNKRGGTAPKRGARCLPPTPLRYTA
jgi:hypothetical protein